MLGKSGLYFLYFLRYLGCVGRMVSGLPLYSSSFWCVSPWSATTNSLHHVRVETNLCAAGELCICPRCRKTCMPMRQPYCWSVAWLGPTSHGCTIHRRHWLWLIFLSLSCCPHLWSINIFVWSNCSRLHVAPSSFLLVLLLPSFDRLSSSSCPLLVRSKVCMALMDHPFVFVKTAFCFHCHFVFVVESASLPPLRSDRSLFSFSSSSRIRCLHAHTTFDWKTT